MPCLRKLSLILLLGALVACDEPEKQENPLASGAGACKAEDYAGLVGQPRKVLEDMDLPDGTRIVGPADPVTMDFRPGRLNFEIGKDGRIAKIGCY